MIQNKALKDCPSCKKQVPEVLRIDGGMRQRLRESTGSTSFPAEACTECYNDLVALISKGAQLKAQLHAKEQQRASLWKERVDLVKNAHVKMETKAFSEAAVLYEKYLRIIEIVYDVEPGGLNPKLFSNRARSKELGVVCMVLWDLVRIYDVSARYGDRQQKTANKLAEFCKAHSSIGRKIIVQAQIFKKRSKNPDLIQSMISQSNLGKRACFVATAVFQSPEAEEVIWLQAFRDQILEKRLLGRIFVSAYYFFSPSVAKLLTRHTILQFPIRLLLKRAVTYLKIKFTLIIGPNF